MNANDPQDLEAKMHRVLHGLPNRKAPSGLEGRILAELSRRAALPWWKKSFAHWPSSVRLAFLALSVVAAALLAFGVYQLANSSGARALAGGVSSGYGWFIVARDVASAAGDRVRMLLASIPPVLLYGGAALIALSYACVAALGAATLRALVGSRQNS
jgi:hypothetical protein